MLKKNENSKNKLKEEKEVDGMKERKVNDASRREYLECAMTLLSCNGWAMLLLVVQLAGGAELWWWRASLGVKGTTRGEEGFADIGRMAAAAVAKGLLGNHRCTESKGLVRLLLHE